MAWLEFMQQETFWEVIVSKFHEQTLEPPRTWGQLFTKVVDSENPDISYNDNWDVLGNNYKIGFLIQAMKQSFGDATESV